MIQKFYHFRYREQMKQRRLKIERLMEWQKDLVDKLGVSMLEIKETPLPSEEDLQKITEQMEILQSERDKRVEIFLNTQIEIKDIMGEYKVLISNDCVVNYFEYLYLKKIPKYNNVIFLN